MPVMNANIKKDKVKDKLNVKKKDQLHRKVDRAYTYIVECGDGSLYTGWTNHLEERMKSHNEGKGAKYTRSRLPVRLVYYEEFATKQEAMKREFAIKQLTRRDKILLIEKQSVGVRKRCEQIAKMVFGDKVETQETI